MPSPLRPRLWAAFCAGFIFLFLFASPGQATKFAGAWMADGGGARPLGMGSAFVAVADDASATFWNPAGLAGQTNPELLLMHSERFGDLVDRDFVSFVFPLKGDHNQALGLSVIRSGVDDIPFTDHLAPLLDDNNDGVVDDEEAKDLFLLRDQIRFESDQSWAITGSYARDVGKWQLGGNVKVITQSIGEYSSWGLGIDLGLLRRDWWKKLDVGVRLSDATSTYLSWSTGNNETISPVLVTGAAYDFNFESLKLDILFSGDLETHFDNRNGFVAEGTDTGGIDGVDQFGWGGGEISSNVYLGTEVTLSKRVSLRAGSHGGFDAENWTFGAGLNLRPLKIDYAYAGDVLGIDDPSFYTHRISLSVIF